MTPGLSFDVIRGLELLDIFKWYRFKKKWQANQLRLNSTATIISQGTDRTPLFLVLRFGVNTTTFLFARF